MQPNRVAAAKKVYEVASILDDFVSGDLVSADLCLKTAIELMDQVTLLIGYIKEDIDRAASIGKGR